MLRFLILLALLLPAGLAERHQTPSSERPPITSLHP